MPRTGITAYDLLFSCPSDVVQFKSVIEECVETLNQTLKLAYNSEITIRHWSTDSYPKSGGKPQDILNETLVKKCDAAVAIFWTKFGTPTDRYGSGTEEEIAEMLSDGKQVFVYFLDIPVPPSSTDYKQYEKVEQFREKYTQKGVYGVIHDEAELRKQFINHLTQYFVPIIAGTKIPSNVKNAPLLKIKNADTMSGTEAKIKHTDFSNCEYINKIKDIILRKISSLNETFLPQREKCASEGEDNSESTTSNLQVPDYYDEHDFDMNQYLDEMFIKKTHNVEITQDWKNSIMGFAHSNNIQLDSNFWNMGNLKEEKSVADILRRDGTSLEGTDEEKNRYNTIKQLYVIIEEYNEFKSFFGNVDSQSLLALTVSNDGTTYDEDIDVKVIVDKGHLVTREQLPDPECFIVKDILDLEILKSFMVATNDTINEYSGYPSPIIRMPKVKILNYFGNDYNDENDEELQKYTDELDRLFCYEFFSKDDKDIIKFHIGYLKHHTTMAFPSVLVFNKVPDFIEYEISSKHSQDVMKGKFTILKENG